MATEAAAAASVRAQGVKPSLRGVPDVIATIIAVPAAALLMVFAQPGLATLSAVIYTICLVTLFATSATYHTPMWPVGIRKWWRALDHSAIYLFIAGSYTPACLLMLESGTGHTILTIIWSIAALGLAKSFLWPRAPRVLSTVVYLAMGWLIVPFLPAIYIAGGATVLVLWAIGGLSYSIGAIIYIKRWPNPWPATFGYHEVFHMFVIGAGAVHYAAFWRVIT